jgi:hypothetical protein
VSITCQDRVQGLGERVRFGDYQVDPEAVADAIVRRIFWEDVPAVEDVPDVLSVSAIADPGPRSPRLRGLVRVRSLVTPSQLSTPTLLPS